MTTMDPLTTDGDDMPILDRDPPARVTLHE